ncbi:MAG: redoxin domain-containing protein [Gammaproteobacteria bacterium]|nr:redoxin domain-containing protein [Gammaproteobacteria bacterium]
MTQGHLHKFRIVYLTLCATLFWHAPVFAEQHSIKAGDTDIGVQVYPAKGKLILLWQPHEAGIQSGDQHLAEELAARGIEVWILDLLEDYFLPNTANNMDRLPPEAFAAVIAAAAGTGKYVIAASSGRGAIPVLRGIRQWQLTQPTETALLGTVLVSPKLFTETPDPGMAGQLMPIASATNQTIVLLQPDKSPWYWKLDQTLAGLQQGGSDVYLWPLQNARDRFYFRPDASEREKQMGDRLATYLHTAIRLLQNQGVQRRQAVALTQTAPVVPEGKKEHVLAKYKGDPQPPPLRLPDVHGAMIDLNDFKGYVVLVNFWATWCPPCVHEMPSMQRLAEHFKGKRFTILGVNMAEDAGSVTEFVRQRVRVTFPIVLDKDGQALKAWRVFAFPTSYVIDKRGQIRYALFGGIDWDTADVKHKLSTLLAE